MFDKEMPKTKLRHKTESDTRGARLQAAQMFVEGDRIRHQVTDAPTERIVFGPEVSGELTGGLGEHRLEDEEVIKEVRAIAATVDNTQVAAVQVVEELTEQELAERHRLELKVERAFTEAGFALRELRDQRLYRSTHRTFEEYCRERFAFQRAHAYRLMECAAVVDNLSPNGRQNEEIEVETTDRQILPTSERQVRPLTILNPDEQREVWQQAVEQAGGKVPSGRVVKDIVERLKAKQLIRAADFCVEGDIFTLTRLMEQRKYNGCWAIVTEINDFTVKVEVHDAVLTVKPDNLNPLDDPQTHRELPQLLKRIKQLRDCGMLDRVTYTILESLGRQTHLTEMEDKVLTFLEQQYQIKSRPQ